MYLLALVLSHVVSVRVCVNRNRFPRPRCHLFYSFNFSIVVLSSSFHAAVVVIIAVDHLNSPLSTLPPHKNCMCQMPIRRRRSHGCLAKFQFRWKEMENFMKYYFRSIFSFRMQCMTDSRSLQMSLNAKKYGKLWATIDCSVRVITDALNRRIFPFVGMVAVPSVREYSHRFQLPIVSHNIPLNLTRTWASAQSSCTNDTRPAETETINTLLWQIVVLIPLLGQIISILLRSNLVGILRRHGRCHRRRHRQPRRMTSMAARQCR